MLLDSVRRQAHRVASSNGGDGALNYNPFARTRSREQVSDEERNTVRRTISEPGAPVIEESRDEEKEFGHQRHHNTEPTVATPAHNAPGSSTDRAVPQTNGDEKVSDDGTVVGSGHHSSNGVTKRGKFKGIFRKNDDGGEENELKHVDSDQLSLEERKKRAHKAKIPIGAQIRFVLFGAWINVLLIMVPVGFAVFYAKIGPVPVFIINFVAIIPLAAMLSTATEELAIRVGETLGGLLNATFGNAVELIVSVQALIKNEITIVKTSLIGSMLSNLLLVLGMSFFLGGVNRLEQFFNVTVAQTAASLLALCIASLIIPTVFHNMIAEDNVVAGDAEKNQELVSTLLHCLRTSANHVIVTRNRSYSLVRLWLLPHLPAQDPRNHVQRSQPESREAQVFKESRR
jgi:Ca2+:H+ antiporter